MLWPLDKNSSYVLEETNDSLRVSLNVMTMITIPVQVNNHHAGKINIFGILNISQTGPLSALGG